MPFWTFAVVVIVLATFTATLRHRLLETYFPPIDEGSYVTATIGPGPDRWFVAPPLLRLEEGSFALPSRDDDIRPAYAIAFVLYLFALISIVSDGWLTHRLIVWTTDFSPVMSITVVGAVMAAYHTQRLVRGRN